METIAPASLATTTRTEAGDGFSRLTSEDFTKIILTELGKQDPLAPNDTNTLIQQLSGIRSIQSNMDLSEGLGRLVGQDEFAAAAGLIGKSVAGLDESSARVTGVVSSVSRTSEGAVMTLADGTRVAFADLDTIREAEAAGDAAEGETP
jgi:flagellar basal-body rod modification protein FlgD